MNTSSKNVFQLQWHSHISIIPFQCCLFLFDLLNQLKVVMFQELRLWIASWDKNNMSTHKFYQYSFLIFFNYVSLVGKVKCAPLHKRMVNKVDEKMNFLSCFICTFIKTINFFLKTLEMLFLYCRKQITDFIIH